MNEPSFLIGNAPDPTGATEIKVGIGSKIGDPNYRVLIKNNINHDVIISIYMGMETDCFRDIKYSNKFVLIGVGDSVYRYNFSENAVTQIKLEGYFGGLYSIDDIDSNYFKEGVLIGGASTLALMDSEGQILWETPNLGVDGVIVHRIENNIIFGSGEFDPPGGWEEFEVNVESGKKHNGT